jgi:Barstar (barnase inhibitor)
MNCFFFVKDPLTLCGHSTLLVRVPGGLSEKSDLLQWFASNLQFPDYYGENWDALVDCLRDLSWIHHHRVVLFHDCLPLAGHNEWLSIYLDILGIAAESWKNDSTHELVIAFDPSCRSAVEAASSNVDNF